MQLMTILCIFLGIALGILISPLAALLSAGRQGDVDEADSDSDLPGSWPNKKDREKDDEDGENGELADDVAVERDAAAPRGRKAPCWWWSKEAREKRTQRRAEEDARRAELGLPPYGYESVYFFG
ncbi:hypothetical protein F5Y18DRAFT_427763 [Xylariaceae sp. FL1019]|nr:hypothetical protein F5Y18DRAFT_427763 [Xylariaceae sp. FL1019]